MADEEIEVEENTSISDQLATAWDAAEETDDADDGIESSSGTTDTASGDSGEPVIAANPDADGETVPDGEELSTLESSDSDSLEIAPKSLSPAAREVWKDAPEAVKAEFKRMDSRMEGLAQKFGANAQRAEQMDRTIAPYQQYMQMNGGPGKSIQSLLQTGATLQMGSPQQKAQIVAQLIGQFGVDIESLDNMLVGNAPTAETQQMSAVQQAVQQAVAPYQQTMADLQQRQQNENQHQQQAVGNEIQQFANDPANEFYKDVAPRMADELDQASKNGQQMSLKQAYDTACRVNPEIWKIMASREAAKSIGNKRKAATSIHGTPGGEGGGDQATNLRGAIEAAWENTGRM
jgi:hypothetical protein